LKLVSARLTLEAVSFMEDYKIVQADNDPEIA